MHLFKSQSLHEPPRVAAPSYRDRGFGRRYGRHTHATFDPCSAGNDDGDGAFAAERELLRRMADYDCAA